MQNKVFIARTKTALKSRAELNGLDINDYVIFKLNDKARQNETLKSVVNGIDNPEYKLLMVHKSFVVITTDGGLQVNANMLSENSYAQELNTPEEEKPGDKYVVEGVVKSALAKLEKGENLSDEERAAVANVLKSWGTHDSEEVSEDEEFVDELETKATTGADGVLRPDSQPFDADPDAAKVEARINKSAEGEEADEDEDGEDDDEAVTKSVRSRLSKLTSAKEELLASLKSFGSISDDEPVFQNKNQAQRFAQVYNGRVNDPARAEVAPASRHVRNRYGARAKFVIEFNK